MDQPAPRLPEPLRPMRWWDIAGVLDLERELFVEDAWTAEMFWSELARPESRYYLVAEDRAGAHPIVGYAGLLAGAREADVQTIAVRRSHWGTGIGRALLTALLAEASRRGCDQVLLEVRVDNERAQALYRRFGFVPVGVRRGYYQQAGMDALVMKLSGVRERVAAGG
jgi:[ribosomal protein S18]-alanine N-acetyltransferase